MPEACLAWLFLAFLSVPRAGANCLASLEAASGEARDTVFFPNWTMAYAASFNITDWITTCPAAGCLSCHSWAGDSCGGVDLQLASLTIVNFGTAVSGTDIKAVYWASDCGGTRTYHTMTAVAPKMWTWRWDGVEPNPTLIFDAKADPPLYCQVKIYADIAGTPTDDTTIQLGIPYDDEALIGGMTDMCCCNVFWSAVSNPIIKTIKYVTKFVDRMTAAPGDQLNYTIYYASPGPPGNVVNLEIIDTIPEYMHYVPASSVPPADAYWDPEPGPPGRLRWTIPGPLPNLGGPTGRITFKMSVDWGVDSILDPGGIGGQDGAAENSSLWNSATASFGNLSGPYQKAYFSNRTRTTIMRFLFWELADRDLIYANTPIKVDEITYSIFVKNMSATKTWWDVSIWNTVPAELNVWAPDCGIKDPCVGWTMTPSGCAQYGGGSVLTPSGVILTWKLDMPPKMTLTIQWKAQVSPQATVGATAISKVSILEYGKTLILDGTGHSTTPRNFTHEAAVVLRTMYVSYVGYDYSSCFSVSDNYYFIVFYALHPDVTYQLFMHNGVCGLNTSIVNLAPPVPCNTWGPNMGGCTIGPARIPHYYGALASHTSCNDPAKDLYKLVSTAPILWEVSPTLLDTNEDSEMYATASTLSFKGKLFYSWRRTNYMKAETAADPSQGDYFGVVNTGDVPTTVHLFHWSLADGDWEYYETRTIDPVCQWIHGGTPQPLEGHWRVISSDTDLIVWKSFCFEGVTDFDNMVTMAPATNGNLTAGEGETFFAYCAKRWGGAAHTETTMVLTNLGPDPARFEIYSYVSDEPLLTAGGAPPVLGGASGHWIPTSTGYIGTGYAAPDNPYIFGRDPCTNTEVGFTESYTLYRILVREGGPLQVRPGRGGLGRYGGYTLHGLDDTGESSRTVSTFWHSQYDEANGNDLVVFCPSRFMRIRCVSEDGYSAEYETTGADQAVSFCRITELEGSCATNYKVTVESPPGGRVIAMANGGYFTERHYACPFLATGVHYEILAPAVVFSGQSFWITVVALGTAGGTKTDYDGETLFSSTDPAAMMGMVGMGGYIYDWEPLMDYGVKMFVNVVLKKLGMQNIAANDLWDGSVTGLTSVLVVGADVKLTKEPRLVIASSGDQVQFRICWSNYSSATAYDFTVTDAVPMGTKLVVPQIREDLICGVPSLVSVAVAYSTATTPTMPATFTTLNPTQGLPAMDVRWLKWTVGAASMKTTGCLCFRVSVY